MATTQREFIEGVGLQTGCGFDAVATSVCGDCVERSELQGSGGQRVTFTVAAITSRSALSEVLSVSASMSLAASVGGMPISGSGKIAWFNARRVNNFAVFIVISASVRNSEKRMRAVKLEDSARDLFARDPGAFRRRCGDEFMIGETTGGEMHGVFEFHCHDETEHRKLTADFSASGGLGTFSGAADFSLAWEKISSYFRGEFEFKFFRAGGSTTKPEPTTPREVLDYAKEFPLMVAQPGGSVPVTAIFMDYGSLDLPQGATPIDIANQKATLERLAAHRLRLLDMLDSIEYLLFNPLQFEPFEAAEWNKKANDVKGVLETITTSARACYLDFKKCDEVPHYDIPVVILPRRREASEIGAIDAAREAAQRAKQHARGASEAAIEMARLVAGIATGPAGKVAVDKARIQLQNVSDSLRLCEQAMLDARVILSDDPVVVGLKQDAQRAFEDAQIVLQTAEQRFKGAYAIGCAPYWKGPTAIKPDGWSDDHGWATPSFSWRIVGNPGRQHIKLSDFAYDPEQGEVWMFPIGNLKVEHKQEGAGTYTYWWAEDPPERFPRIYTFHSRAPIGERAGCYFEIEYEPRLEGKVLSLPLLLRSEKTGLESKVEFRCFLGTVPAEPYFDFYGKVQNGGSPDGGPTEGIQEFVVSGESLGWRNQRVRLREVACESNGSDCT